MLCCDNCGGVINPKLAVFLEDEMFCCWDCANEYMDDLLSPGEYGLIDDMMYGFWGF